TLSPPGDKGQDAQIPDPFSTDGEDAGPTVVVAAMAADGPNDLQTTPQTQPGGGENAGAADSPAGPNHLGLGPPTVQADPAAQGQAANAVVQDRLAAFAAGWPGGLLDERIDKFLATLVDINHSQGMSNTKLDKYLTLLVERLKDLDYHTLGKPPYRKRLLQ